MDAELQGGKMKILSSSNDSNKLVNKTCYTSESHPIVVNVFR